MEGNESIWWVAQANRVADSGQELKSEILFFFLIIRCVWVLAKEFLADLATFCYNLMIYVVVEQPLGSMLFQYGPVLVT